MLEHYNYFNNYPTRDTRFYIALQGLSKGNMSADLYDAFGNYVPKELPYTIENALKAYNFAIIDLGLYLDTHPNDEKSIELYNKIASKGKELFATYQSLYGPLIAEMYTGSAGSWDWIESPWPWNKKEV